MSSPNPRLQIIVLEQTKLLFEQLPFVLFGVLVGSTGLVAVLWHLADQSNLLLWLASVYLLTLFRWVVRRNFLSKGAQFNTQQWLKIAVVLAAASGTVWGIGSVLFFSTDHTTLLALSTFLAAMVAGAVSSHACHTPAYSAFVLPATLPFVARCLMEDDVFFHVLGLSAFVFVFINIRYGYNLQSRVIQSIQLRFQNADLITQLTQQKKVAEEASIAKTRFLAAASHDLRQPVQAIELLVDALDKDLADHPSKYLLDSIREAGYGLRNLLNTMLDSAKINAAAVTPKPQHIALHPLLERLCKELGIHAQHKGLDLKLIKTRAWVYTDPALLELILRNYIENAIKYTPQGRVLVGCRRVGKSVRIEVHDTGVGISAPAQATIFQEFYQLGNQDNNRAKGLGLGLYIAQSLARLMSSPIGVRSEPGRGSLFYIVVPRGKARDTIEESVNLLRPTSRLNGKTVVLIEDDEFIRASVIEMLNRWHCTTVAAEDVEVALRMLASLGKLPDVVVADYRLRNRKNGLDAVKTLQEKFGNVPAVILTGDTNPERIREVQAIGHSILHKPLSGNQLRNMLGQLVAHKIM